MKAVNKETPKALAKDVRGVRKGFIKNEVGSLKGQMKDKDLKAGAKKKLQNQVKGYQTELKGIK
jgi:hypothetical protein